MERTAAVWAGWHRIVSSPQARCRAVAEALARSSGCEAMVDERLCEYDFGDWDGRPFDGLWADHGEALAAFLGDPDSGPPPNGETAADFRARVRSAWRDLLEVGAGERVLVVGHGGVLRQFVADILDIGPAAHAALEWPHATLSRVRVVDAPPAPRSQSLVFHAWRDPPPG